MAEDHTRRRPDPAELSPREAVARYLRRRKPDSTEKSIDGWDYRLKLFHEWCSSVGIEQVGQLQGYDTDEYYEHRSRETEPVTLEGEMYTLRTFCEFLEDLGAVEEGLADTVRIPDLDPEERSSDTKLHADDAQALLSFFRESAEYRGTRRHAFLELAWYTGARQGGLRALDIRDVYLDDNPYVEFRHRPNVDTRLKNGRSGERPVGLRDETAEVLQRYVDHHRYDSRDEHGRQPFLASRDGRPTTNTMRVWSYLATQPCLHSECPHGKERETCEWVAYSHASKCPSTRSPHHIRTGTITWLLNKGWPPEDVAERVNATVKTIEQHYDKADPEQRRRRLRERMEQRRRPLLDHLEFDDDDN